MPASWRPRYNACHLEAAFMELPGTHKAGEAGADDDHLFISHYYSFRGIEKLRC